MDLVICNPISTNLGLFSIFMRPFEPILEDLAVCNLACAYFGPLRAGFRSFLWVFNPIWAHSGPFYLFEPIVINTTSVNVVAVHPGGGGNDG